MTGMARHRLKPADAIAIKLGIEKMAKVARRARTASLREPVAAP
jgi:hypothetical protein